MRELLEGLGRGRGGCLVVDAVPADVDLAGVEGVEVVRHRASTDEQLLAYAALGDLCEPFLDLIDELPPAQAAALRGALALGEPSGDALAVAVAFRSLLHLAADRRPLAVVVEDAHLLDRGSAAALARVCRRLDDVALVLVVAQDPRHPGALSLPGARRTPPPGGDEPVGPVSNRVLARAADRHSAADRAAALEAAARQAAADVEPAGEGEPDDLGPLLTEAAEAWIEAGQVERAQAVATEARRCALDPVQRAAADLVLGRTHALLGHGGAAATHLDAAAAVGAAAPDIALTALLLRVPGAVFSGRVDEARAAVAAAEAMVATAGRPPDHPQVLLLRAASLGVALASGAAVDEDEVAAGIEPLVERPDLVAELPLLVATVALPLVWLDRYDQARTLLQEVVAGLRRRGALGALPMPLCALSVTERRAGRPTRALIHASEAADLAEQTGNRNAWLFAQAELANVHSLFGDVERCRTAARAILGPGGPGRGAYRTSALTALATVEMWSGEPAAVIELLEPLLEGAEPLAQSVTLYLPTLLTAYVAVGRHDDARAVLARLEAVPSPPGSRLAANVARCAAVLAPAEEREAAFAAAVEAGAGHPLSEALTRLLYARRLLADGDVARGAALLHDLSELTDENHLGVARAARLSLTRLGLVVATGDPAWARLGPLELQVALAAVDDIPALTLADRLRVSPPEIERLRDEVVAVVGARSGPDVGQGMHRPVQDDPVEPAAVEIRLLGGLRVLVRGRPIDLPSGAVSVAVAVLALRRAVHVEELSTVLWPEAEAEVSRRRLRNVLTRIRQAVGPIVVRQGDRLELASAVVVDHHVLERRARRALSVPPGPDRRALVAAALEADRGPLLPEAAYEEWAEPARRQAEARHDDLVAALETDGPD